MGCNQSKHKEAPQHQKTPSGASVSATSLVVPAAQVPLAKKEKENKGSSTSSHNSNSGNKVHNIQVAGHQNLRMGEDGKFLIKPVSRDALVIQHLLDSPPTANLPKTLHFLRPFVADFREASFVQPLPASSTSEKNGLAILARLREELAANPDHKLTFEEYFNKCRERLEAAEDALSAEIEATNGDGDADHTEAATTNPSEGQENLPKAKKSKSSVKKPWELVMANACAGLAAPCVMDIKLGKFRTTPGAPNADVKEAKDDGTTTRVNGVRVTGLHYFAHDADGRIQHTAISKSLPTAWDRKNITTDEKLGYVIDTFLGACCVEKEASATGEDGKSNTDAILAAAVFINNEETKKAAEDAGVRYKVHHLPALAKEMHRQLSLAVKALFTEGQFITQEFAFLSMSVLLVYDAAAWWKNGVAVVPENPSSAAKVLLIDFDRSGPRSEHYSEDKIQFLSAIAALDAYLDRDSGDVIC